MSDDNYNNHNDDEYWDDVYFEEHRDEYSSGGGGGSRGIGKTILLVFLMIWGIMTMLDSPMLGIMIIMLSLVFCK